MTDIAVVLEPRTYSVNSPHSFFKDVVESHRGDFAAAARLDRYNVEISHEIETGSTEGQRNLRARTLAYRQSNPTATRAEVDREVRAATSSTMQGWTTPQYILEQWAAFRGAARTFTHQTVQLPIPDVGLSVSVPSFTSTASAGVQTEGSAVTELDPTGAYITQPIVTIAGQIVASQQLVDRASTQGFTFDTFAYAQLREQYDQNVNIYTMGRALAVGKAITESANSFSVANFYQDVALCREVLYDTLGTRLAPTHIFTTPDLYSYVTRQLDTSNRPMIVPQFAPGDPLWPDQDNKAWRQFTGTVLPGTLTWFVDESIQPQGSNTVVIVSRPDTIVTFEGDEPLVRAYGETIANQLQTVIQLYNYLAVVPRFPYGTAYVTGNAYPTTLI